MRQETTPTIGKCRARLLHSVFWFLVFNLIVFALISLRYHTPEMRPTTPLASAFVVLMTCGHIASVLAVLYFLISLVVVIVPRREIVFPAVCFVALLGTIALIIDTVVFQLYRFHLNGAVLSLLFGDAAGDIFEFSITLFVQAGLIIFGLCVGQLFLLWLANVVSRSSLAPRTATCLTVFFGLSIFAHNGMHIWAAAAGYTPITRLARLLPGYFPLSAGRFFRKIGVTINPVDTVSLTEGGSLNYPRAALQCRPGNRVPSIVWIVIDSWRFDTLSAEITPNIWKFRDRSIQFTDHFSGGSATRSGIFSMFYGVPASYWHSFLAERRSPVLLDELQGQSYELGIFASAKLSSPEFHQTVFSSVKNLRISSEGSSAADRDIDLTGDFLSWLPTRDRARPLFAFIFFDAPHSFSFPSDYKPVFAPSLQEVNYLDLKPDYDPIPFFNRYLNSIHFVDGLIAKILQALEEDGVLRDSIVMITGDHGQEFNENKLNYWGHNGNFSRYQTGVPLLVYWPGKEPGVIKHRTSHFDLAPTVLKEVFRCNNSYDDYATGENLFVPHSRDFLLLGNYNDYALVEKGRITALYSYGGVEVFDESYGPVPGVSADARLLKNALELQSRFLKGS